MSTTTTSPDQARNMEIANTIRGQIGRALVMIGGKNLVAVENGLKFKVICRGTRSNYITITLDSNDTYTFLAQKITGGRFNKKTCQHSPVKTKTILKLSEAYCDMLDALIAEATGLAVRL